MGVGLRFRIHSNTNHYAERLKQPIASRSGLFDTSKCSWTCITDTISHCRLTGNRTGLSVRRETIVLPERTGRSHGGG